MMMRRAVRSIAALAMLCGAASAGAQQEAEAGRPCLTTAEAEAVTLVALPDIIRVTGVACAATVPPRSLLRQPTGAFIDKYQAEADAAWPAARDALARLTDPDIAPLLQSDLARPLLTSMLAPLIVGRIDPRDCPAIDRMVTLLAPLPARNAAGLIVTGAQLMHDGKARRSKPAKDTPDLPLCALRGR